VLARVSLTETTAAVPDPVEHLERLSLTHFGPIDGHDDNLVTAFFVRLANGLVKGSEAVLEFLRSVMDRDDAEDYQTVRDLAWVSLRGVDHGRLTRSPDWYGISGDDPASKPKPKRARRSDLVAAEERRYM